MERRCTGGDARGWRCEAMKGWESESGDLRLAEQGWQCEQARRGAEAGSEEAPDAARVGLRDETVRTKIWIHGRSADNRLNVLPVSR